MTSVREKVVVLVIAHKSELSIYESISLKQCSRILSRYKIVFICPAGLNVSIYKELCPNATFDFIDPVWQSSYAQFNRLKIEPFLYKRYLSYEFILFYEPDAFVFKDELEEWCDKNYDYIGAPWVTDFDKGTPQSPFLGVGNGGFSLRKVSAHLKALRSFSYCIPFRQNWKNRFIDKKNGTNLLQQVGGIFLDSTIRNNTFWALNNYAGLEDQFWGLSVAKNFRWFTIPTIEVAASFSFEMQPRRLYEFNGRQLPFGCHAWFKYDLEFWKPHIEQFGYRLSGLGINSSNPQLATVFITHSLNDTINKKS